MKKPLDMSHIESIRTLIYTGNVGNQILAILRSLEPKSKIESEVPNKGQSVLWLATFVREWDLANELIEQGADIHATCIGEGGRYKGMSVVWLAAFASQWDLVAQLIAKGVDVNSVCTTGIADKGKSVLWLAAAASQWDLAAQLIAKGANIDAICTWKGLHEGQSVLSLAQCYSTENRHDTQESNKDIFYFIYAAFIWNNTETWYSNHITVSPTDLEIIDKIKKKICNHSTIFTIPTIDSQEQSYKGDYINLVPKEIKYLIASECIKASLLEYKLSMICIETFSDKIAKRILVENSLNYYALVLFSNILTALRDNSEMFDTNTQNEMSSNKKTLNQKILKDYFLPAYKKGIENDTSLASMSQDKREQLYEISKNYGNSKLEQKPKKNTLTEGDFTTIFKYIPRYCPEEKLCVE